MISTAPDKTKMSGGRLGFIRCSLYNPRLTLSYSPSPSRGCSSGLKPGLVMVSVSTPVSPSPRGRFSRGEGKQCPPLQFPERSSFTWPFGRIQKPTLRHFRNLSSPHPDPPGGRGEASDGCGEDPLLTVTVHSNQGHI